MKDVFVASETTELEAETIMDESMKRAESLLNWIKEQQDGSYRIEEDRSDNKITLILHTDCADGYVTVNFLQFTIAEYRIVNKAEETVFYLHFELVDEEHARHLFKEMKEALLKQQDSGTINALLCCTCGLTTSYFTMKLNETAEASGTDIHFDAVPYEKLYEEGSTRDIVLIAPQIGYRLKDAAAIMKDIPVREIPVQIFSNYDALGMISFVKECVAEKKETKKAETADAIGSLQAGNGALLYVSIVDMEGRTQLAYRVCSDEKIVAESQIVKEKYVFSDIEDIIELVTRTNPDIHEICLVTPGSVSEGKLTYAKAGIISMPVADMLKEKYGVEVILMNVTDTIALGYSLRECGGEDIAFYFLPTGSYAGSFALVHDGKILGTAGYLGGDQLSAITSITTFPMNPFTLQNTPEGNIELAARYMTGLITYTGCRRIAFYAKMIPEADVLRRKICEFIREEYVPEIIKTESVRRYIYEGAAELLKHYSK